MTRRYPSHATDPATADTLALIAADAMRGDDRERITDAARTVADPAGVIDPNRLRAVLTDPGGALTVDPHHIGSTINALARAGRIVPAGWTITAGSTSGNNGKPARVWRWVDTDDPADLTRPDPVVDDALEAIARQTRAALADLEPGT